MKNTSKTKNWIVIINIISWIIFVGLCIEAGGFIVNGVLTHFLNAEDAGKLWQQVDLSGLYKFDGGHFTAISIFICLVAIMKAIMFYLIISILNNKKFNLLQPFNNEMKLFISRVAYLALGIGLFAQGGAKYSAWLSKQGVLMPDISLMGVGGADVWLFMGVTLLLIAQMFKRGLEIQLENDLTV